MRHKRLHQPRSLKSKPVSLYRKRDEDFLYDKQAIAFHSAVLQKLEEHPELLDIARKNLEEKQQQRFLRQRIYAKWEYLLADVITHQQLKEAVLENSKQGQRLRANTVFTGILTEEERFGL